MKFQKANIVTISIICILLCSCDLSFFFKDPFGEIKGKVYYEDGTPCEGLHVFYGSWVYNMGHPASLVSEESDTTDSNGQFRFTNVEYLHEWTIKILNVPDGYSSSPEYHKSKLDREEIVDITFTLIPTE
ncbi:MAG: hypothetical protein ABIA75_09905 [Candidatus Neomarinimicrobiota bacterium]